MQGARPIAAASANTLATTSANTPAYSAYADAVEAAPSNSARRGGASPNLRTPLMADHTIEIDNTAVPPNCWRRCCFRLDRFAAAHPTLVNTMMFVPGAIFAACGIAYAVKDPHQPWTYGLMFATSVLMTAGSIQHLRADRLSAQL